MDALAASGDRAGAIQHARVYRVARRTRARPSAGQGRARVRRASAAKCGRDAGDRRQSTAPIAYRRPARYDHRRIHVLPSRRRSRVASAARAPSEIFADTRIASGRRLAASPIRRSGSLTAALIVVATIGADRGRASAHGQTPASPGNAVVAIGNIAAYGSDSAQASTHRAASPILLTTSLARVHAIRVVSHGRMLELLHASGRTDTSTGAFLDAARQAGATQMIDGTLYARPGGHLRLDLRRVDLATGAIGDVHTIEGADLFALVDSGTMSLVVALGVSRADRFHRRRDDAVGDRLPHVRARHPRLLPRRRAHGASASSTARSTRTRRSRSPRTTARRPRPTFPVVPRANRAREAAGDARRRPRTPHDPRGLGEHGVIASDGRDRGDARHSISDGGRGPSLLGHRAGVRRRFPQRAAVVAARRDDGFARPSRPARVVRRVRRADVDRGRVHAGGFAAGGRARSASLAATPATLEDAGLLADSDPGVPAAQPRGRLGLSRRGVGSSLRGFARPRDGEPHQRRRVLGRGQHAPRTAAPAGPSQSAERALESVAEPA